MKLTDEERALCLRWKETEGKAGKIPGIPCQGIACLNCVIKRTYTANGYTACEYPTAYKMAVKLLNEDERNNNMSEQLTITKEKVLEAAAKCSTAKEVLKTIFPEAFTVKATHWKYKNVGDREVHISSGSYKSYEEAGRNLCLRGGEDKESLLYLERVD